jgi:hypothetical protein
MHWSRIFTVPLRQRKKFLQILQLPFLNCNIVFLQLYSILFPSLFHPALMFRVNVSDGANNKRVKQEKWLVYGMAGNLYLPALCF